MGRGTGEELLHAVWGGLTPQTVIDATDDLTV